MGQAQLIPRPLYGIGTVARLTGLKPDTLRVWERRYDLGASHKSATGRRQYTQSDLEHLQLVAALVSAGARIGEIAASERKTLERLIEVRSPGVKQALPQAKPRVLFVGEGICRWLEEHQGCLSGVDAQLAPVALQYCVESMLEEVGEVDLLVMECGSLGNSQASEVARMRQKLQPKDSLCMYQQASDGWLRELEDGGVSCMSFPPDRAELAYRLTQCSIAQTVNEGVLSLGDLVKPRPRLVSEESLAAARTMETPLACECPQHLGDLVTRLAEFEQYSTQCAVENWEDAAIHSCIYAYTGQARWLMEKALELVMQNHQDELNTSNLRKTRKSG